VGFGLDSFKSNPSQIKNRTDLGTGFLAVLALLINGLTIFLLPSIIIPFGLKIFLFAAGAMIAWAAMNTWLLGIRGGYVTLVLPCDPVPLGVPIKLNFSTSKAIEAKNWTVEVELYSSREHDRIWSQTFQVNQMENNCLQSEITIPCDEFKFKSVIENVLNSVTLKADDLEWSFDIKTRIATSDEVVIGLQDARSIGTNVPYYPPKSTESWQWRWFKFALAITICVIGYKVISHYDAEVRSLASTKVGVQMDSPAKNIEKKFDISSLAGIERCSGGKWL
jgi:hypothetical protein